VLLEPIEAEAVEGTGAGRYERVEGRGTASGTAPRHFGQDWRLAARHPEAAQRFGFQAFSNQAFVSGVSERDWSLNTPRVRARATMTPGVGIQSQTQQDGAAAR
jgi:hypothetical protein